MNKLLLTSLVTLTSFSAFSNPNIYSDNVIGQCSDAEGLNEARVIQLNPEHIYIQFDKINGSIQEDPRPIVYRMNSDHPYFLRASNGFAYETSTVTKDDELFLGGMTSEKEQLAYPEEYATYPYRLRSKSINVDGVGHYLNINLTDRIDMSRRSILGLGLYHANERRFRRSLNGGTLEKNILDVRIFRYEETDHEEYKYETIRLVNTLMTCTGVN